MTSEYIILFVSLGIILGYCLEEGFRLFRKLSKVEKALQKAIKLVVSNEGDLDVTFSESDLLGEQWRRYRRTFMAESGERHKTDDRAASYFNEGNVLSQRISLRYWLSVPNLLIGMGILGTFVGLVYGISEFDTETVEGVRESISTLLGGMATAFYTSIAGMALSIIFNIVEKWRFKKISDVIRQLANSLDDQYLLTTADKLRFQRQDQQQLALSLFSYKNQEGKYITPGYMLRDMRREAQEQTATLKSFSTDLADGILLSTSTIEALGTNMGEVFQAAMQAKLGPALEGVRTAVEQLREEKAASNEEMVRDVVGDLQEALKDISGQFQTALTGGAIEELKSVAKTVGVTGEVLMQMPATLENLMDKLRTDLIDTTVRLGEETEVTTEAMREEMTKTAQVFSETIKGLQDQTAHLLGQQDENTESVAKLTEGVAHVITATKKLAEDLYLVTDGIEKALGKFTLVSSNLVSTSAALVESGSTLRATTTAFKDESAELQTITRENIQTLRDALTEAQLMVEDYADKFNVIRAGLRDIFGELQQGLSIYQNATREKLNEHLGSFADHLNNATSALSSSVGALNDNFESLSDLLDRASRLGGNGTHERRT